MARSTKMSESQAEVIITRKLIESGERDRLKDTLFERLEDTGWRKTMRELVQKYAHQHGNLENITTEDVVQELAPNATSLISEDIKRDIKRQIQNFLDEQAEDRH